MLISLINRISTILLVLILFSETAFPLPLSRTCFTVAEDSGDLYLGEEIVADTNTHRRDMISYSIGLTPSTTLGLSWSMLNYKLYGGESQPGDAIVDLWHYTGRYLYDRLDTGINLSYRIPFGPDPGIDGKWKNLSVGRSELKITPVLSIRITENELFSINLGYVFRESRDENFFDGLKGNLKDKNTYSSFFGLNPSDKDSFLSSEKLSDDYITAACSIVETRFYPVVLYSELYYAFTDFKDDAGVPSTGVEGEGGSLAKISAGGKYFIRDSVFCNVYGILNPLYSGTDFRWGAGAALNIFF